MLCIYHEHCVDGFGAAWVVRRALGEIECVPAQYGAPPPKVDGRSVVLVDFSYPREVLLAMAAVAKEILILDHHQTAAEHLVDLPANVTCRFDMTRSGARLAWDWYFPDEVPPPLLLRIEDRDLWRFEYSDTRAVMAALFSYPYAFDDWTYHMARPLGELVVEGVSIERKQAKDVRELLAATRRELVIDGHRVPAANLPPTLASDAGHVLAQGAPFAACYWDTPTGRKFSLRSSAEGLDVAKVAEGYGGGGHRHAAGFEVSFAEAAGFEVKDGGSE